MFFSLADEQATAIRQKLLETLATETQRGVRNKISYAVAEIARQYIDNGRFGALVDPQKVLPFRC
jgi:hypothetical protein